MITYPDTTTKTNAYDGPGNLVSVTDQAQNQVQYNYDAANQLVNVVQVNSPNSNANTTTYGYDSLGNAISLADANTHTTFQSFDPLNELTQKVLPDGTLTESRTYDSNGNLATLTHFNGAVTTYTYDQLNRLLSRATPGETTVSFTYTQTGQRATMTDQSGTTNYSYDSMDRLTTKATPEGTLNYTYDAAGHVASIASSNVNGASMAYTYDSLNRLTMVTDNRLSSSNFTTYTYDDANNVATVTYPNGVQSTFAYDTLNRVTGLSSQPGSYEYTRGPTGNLTGATESTGRLVSWSYDGIYRLTNETISLAPSGKNGSVGYGLDPVGNRTSDTSSLSGISSGSFSFNPDDELASESYDQNGNVVATGGKTFSYDSQNELVSMNASGTAANIKYDGFGNRVSKTVNGITTQYLVEDDKNPTGLPQIFDELTNGVVTRTYTYGLQRISEEQLVSNILTPSFYGYDGGGTVRNLTNTAGAVTDTYEYDAFGNKVNSIGTTPNNYLYRGEEFDPDLGLYYLRARYYNSLTGRFTGVDPLTDQGEKRYEYADADPVDGQDPRGTEDLSEYRPLMPGRFAASFLFPSVLKILGPWLPAPPPPQPPCTKCRAQMKYRPTGPGNQGVQNHSFWYVQDRNGNTWNISAGVQKPSPYLQAWVYSPSIIKSPMMGGSFYQDFPSSPTCFDSGSSCKVCDQVDKMIQFAKSWPSNKVLYNPYGPNSNSFAHKVGTVGGFYPSMPPGPLPTYGWDTPLN